MMDKEIKMYDIHYLVSEQQRKLADTLAELIHVLEYMLKDIYSHDLTLMYESAEEIRCVFDDI